MEKVKVISLIGEFGGDGDLWFDISDPATPQRLFDYIVSNMEENQKYEFEVGEVSKEDFDSDDV